MVAHVRMPIAFTFALAIGCAVPAACQNPNSGIYGTVAAAGGAPPGHSAPVRGKCVELLNAKTRRQVATATCDDRGGFRVALPPGRYIVEAAGQKAEITVRPGEWVRRRFFMPLPSAPGRARRAQEQQ